MSPNPCIRKYKEGLAPDYQRANERDKNGVLQHAFGAENRKNEMNIQGIGL